MPHKEEEKLVTVSDITVATIKNAQGPNNPTQKGNGSVIRKPSNFKVFVKDKEEDKDV